MPQAYLRAFADTNERLFAYRKNNPSEPHLRSIRDVAAENYYYAQIKPDGSRDLETLEKLFQASENLWPDIVGYLAGGNQLPSRLLGPFYEFLGGLRVRGPASRDAMELALAEQVRAFGQIMEDRGDFAPPPPGLKEALAFQNLVISIDPHQSLHLMPSMLKGFAEVLDQVGFTVFVNRTGLPLVTSDNPIVYFDPTVPEERLRPYSIENGPPIEILLAITPSILLVGHSDWAGPYSHETIRFRECKNPQIIKRANRYTTRFAYREVYANTREHDLLIAKWSGQSPVARNSALKTPNGTAVITQWIFGPRPQKPKWKPTKPSSA